MTRSDRLLICAALVIGIAISAMLLAPRLGLTPEILPAATIETWQVLGVFLPACAIIYGSKKDRNALRADGLILSLVVMFGVLALIYSFERLIEVS